MIQRLASTLLFVTLAGLAVALPSPAPQNKKQFRSTEVSSVARCRELKAEAAKPQRPIPGTGVIMAGCPPGEKCEFEHESSWYLNLTFKTLTVTDEQGHRDSFTQTRDPEMQTVASADYLTTCAEGGCMNISLSIHHTYELTITNGEYELMLDLVKGIDNVCPDEAIRYLGQPLPPGSRALLRITPRGAEDIRYDQNGDGKFSFTMKPVGHVYAPLAWDRDPPTVKFSQRVQDAHTLLVTIVAEDESGVRSVLFSLDGSDVYHRGTTIKVDRAQPHLIRAFADDVLGNRGPSYEYTTKP